MEVAEHLQPAVVLRTVVFDGNLMRSHCKFISIDHRFLVVTSDNFSRSAENANIGFGVLIDNCNLARGCGAPDAPGRRPCIRAHSTAAVTFLPG